MRLRLRGWMKDGFVLVYRIPVSSVGGLVPEGFDLITRGGDAFWNLAISRVEALRPWGLPPWGGFDCRMVTCGLHVSTETATGRRIRGLYPIRSDAEPKFLRFLGKESLGFEFRPAAIEFTQKENRVIVTVDSHDDDRGHAYLSVDVKRSSPVKPESADLLGYPGTILSWDPWLSRIRWTEMTYGSLFPWKPVHVQESRWNLFRDLDQEQAVLQTACRIEPAEFTWHMGLITDLERRASLPAI